MPAGAGLSLFPNYDSEHLVPVVTGIDPTTFDGDIRRENHALSPPRLSFVAHRRYLPFLPGRLWKLRNKKFDKIIQNGIILVIEILPRPGQHLLVPGVFGQRPSNPARFLGLFYLFDICLRQSLLSYPSLYHLVRHSEMPRHCRGNPQQRKLGISLVVSRNQM